MKEKKKKEYPEEGELVVCTVKQIFPYGAFVTLDDYGDRQGMIHIKEISSSWVKNIRDFVREGQKTVTKVLRVDPEKSQVDLSLRHTTTQQRKWKMQESKKGKKVEKLLEYYARENNVTMEKIEEEIIEPIENKYPSLHEGLEDLLLDKSKLKIIPSHYRESLFALLQQNMEHPAVEITGVIDIRCFENNGIEVIKEILSSVMDKDSEITLLGSPRYLLRVRATNYKAAEEKMKNIQESIQKGMTLHEGHFEFSRK